LLALFRLYRGLKPDLVHHITHKPVLYGSLAARLVGVPAVVNAISGLGYAFVAEGWRADRRRQLMMTLYRMALRHPRMRVIFQNREDVALFEAAGVVRADQVVLIPGSGVDLSRFKPSPEPEGTPVVVLPARMLWDKGVGDFVAAARLLRQRGVVFRALLAGESDPGNPRSIPRDQLAGWAAEGAVEWDGYRDDMARVLADCHVVCLPSSYREGVPKALLEAAAAGRPIVTTDVPGCRDVVTPGENGLLVPPRNPAALAEALEMLIASPALRVRFGSRGRARAERDFGDAAVVTTTLRVYHALLSE
jgi:glycosyltransferase involved in cell wall biosynthesis